MKLEKKPPKPAIDRCRAYVGKMDAAIEGAGGDHQTFVVACRIVSFGLNDTEALTVIKEYNERCQPKWTDYDLERKIANARGNASPDPEFCNGVSLISPFKPSPKVKKWPPLDEVRHAQILKSCFNRSDLWDASPWRFQDDDPVTNWVMPILFPHNPLICAGYDNDHFTTAPLSELGDLSVFQLVVPNPMSKLNGKIKRPRKDGSDDSQHSLDNTGPRRYAVIEFDEGTTDDHAALLHELENYAPFVMAVHSGGKSLHGWFYVEQQPEDKVLRFYRYAVSLGADHATFTKSQFVRMPDGLRKNGQRQVLYYFNPKPLERLCPTS